MTVDAPFGFRPVRHKTGAPYSGAVIACWVDSSDSTALYKGDPVVLDGTSNTSELKFVGVGVSPIGTLPGVTRATAGAAAKVFGVVVGFAVDDRSDAIYSPASTEAVVYVALARDYIFEVQADAAFAAADVGSNVNIIYTHAGSTVTGLSGAEVDATASADATYQCNVLRVKNSPDNDAATAGNVVEVIFNLDQMTTGVGQAGV